MPAHIGYERISVARDDEVVEKVGETAGRNFRRALVVARTRTVMEHVGVRTLDTGENFLQRKMRKLPGHKPWHVQTPGVILKAPDSPEIDQKWVTLGERQARYQDVSGRKHTVPVVYARTTQWPPEDTGAWYVPSDLAISDGPYRHFGSDGDSHGMDLADPRFYVVRFDSIVRAVAEQHNVQLPTAEGFARATGVPI